MTTSPSLRWTLALVGAFSLAALSLRASGPTITKTWTFDADFASGVLNSVNYTVVPDQLQLNESSSSFPILWIPNAGEATMSKVDTSTGKELARYKTAPVGGGGAWSGAAPSRTAVDVDGNCYVGNRGFGGQGQVLKILATPVDKNGNGTIETSTDLNNSGTIGDAPGELLTYGADEAIAWVTNVGTYNQLVRSVALDRNGFVWAGLFNAQRYYKLNGSTGASVGYVDTPGVTPYGAQVDANGILWSSTLTWRVGAIDTNTNTYLGCRYLPHSGYGIAISRTGEVLIASLDYGGGFMKFTPGGVSNTGVCAGPGPVGSVVTLGPNYQTTGVAIDANNDVYLAHYIANKATKNNITSGATIWDKPSGGYQPRGVAIAHDGHPWLIHLDSNNAVRLNKADGTFLLSRTVGAQPYAYTDLTGFSTVNVTQQTGTWIAVHNSGAAGTAWNSIVWNASTPGSSTVTAEVRAGDTPALLAAAAFVPATNAGALPGTMVGQYVEVKMRLTAGTGADKPVVYDVSVNGTPANSAPNALCQDVTVAADASCQAPASIDASSSDPDGDPITLEQTPAGPFTLGTTPATLTVTDDKGATASCSANVTVVDQTAPVISSVTASQSTMWPPNHKMVPITVATAVSDACTQSGAVQCAIVSVSSNEPENGLGDGDTAPDWEIVNGTTVNLRSERAGMGSGRVYTVTVRCTDGSGNASTSTVTVSVPKSQGRR